MAYIYATSEFTDLNDTDWKVDLVADLAGSDTNYAFNLGPDGFNLSYDFDEYDRCKPIVGSRVQITLYHPKVDSTYFDALYAFLDGLEEGSFRLEIYRDPDSSNELWWAGEILPEQTVIPDDYPFAPVTLTAVDGLANLKGIDYNNDGAAYTGTATILEHLHNLIQKMHISSIWGASDIELRFFEDFIGKEYKDDIGGAQNKQLENAKISHDAFYNKDNEGIKQYFSCYQVLESLALTFNVSIFMAQGSIWWVPLGAIQSHASNGIDVANHMLGDGTVTYNTVANTTISALFGSNSTQYEKLNGFERSSAPSFKQVVRTREYQGMRSLVHDSLYSRTQIIASDVLSDEDLEYYEDQRFLVSGTLVYLAPPFGWITPDIDRVARVKLELTIKFGDAGGTTNYLKRNYGFDSGNIEQVEYQNFTEVGWPGYDITDPWDLLSIYRAQPEYPSWDTNAATFDIVTQDFDKIIGTYDPLFQTYALPLSVPFQFVTPELPADATGLQISAALTGLDWQGSEDTDIGATSNSGGAIQYRIDHFKIQEYSSEQGQEFSSVEITATNPDTARYDFNQGTTLVGDRISDYDLGVIKINNGSNYVDSTEWTNLQSSTASLSINGLGVKERLAANRLHSRMERGTLYQTGSTYIHPYTILTNSDYSDNYFQVTGLKFIANRCEYDLECMFLTRNITGVTVEQDNSKGDLFNPPPGPLPTTKGPATDNIVSDNSTKLNFIGTDSYGVVKITKSTGAGSIDIVLPTEKASAGVELVSIDTWGGMAPLADGASGEFLKTDGSGVLSWGAAGGGGAEDGWHGSTDLIKVMPIDFFMNDDSVKNFIVVEDDVTGYLGITNPSKFNELYAFVAIPKTYKATHVQVYGSIAVTSGVEAFSFDHTTGAIVSKGTGDVNSSIDITDITSSDTSSIVIKLILGTSGSLIYGADVTIEKV